MTRILLIDDHPMVRQGIGRILTSALADVEIGEASSGEEALARLRDGAWDVALLDLTLPGDHGARILRRMRQQFPATPVLVVSMHPAEEFAAEAVRAGAAGYLVKNSDPAEIVSAVSAVLRGERLDAPAAESGESKAGGPLHSLLSDREYQVLRLIGAGRTVSQIAEELSLSVKTVSTYRARILEKMNLHTTAELMHYVITHRLIP
jgi:two-component system, NarL family, invasion response regulator UvrY